MFLYWETVNIIHKADYQFLSDELDSLQTILETKPINFSVLRQEIIENPTESSNSIYRYYIRLNDENNQLIMETPGTSDILPVVSHRNLIVKKSPKQSYRHYSFNKTNYLIIQSPVKFSNQQYGNIQILLDISYQHIVMSDRKFLLISLLLSAISSLTLGFFIANRGMRSVFVLKDTVKQITATSLHQRIDPKSLPTDLRKLGIAFNQMLDRIESSFVRLKQFSSDLAHELRTPIHNLIGETELALSHLQTPEEYQQVLISNMEEYNRISHMIENILFLSRAENPQLEIQTTLLHVKDEIAVICDYYQAMADDKQISMSYQGDAELKINSIMFRRMINNLLSNALKYTPANGWVRFHITDSNHEVRIQLSDNGIGIAKQHLPKIFDRFYRVDSDRAQQSGGIGLGLPIVKSIVDLHHGSITFNSELNKGTTILLIFPK